MNKIDTDFVRQKWQYKPEFGTADTSSYATLTNTINTTVSGSYLADEINRRVNKIYREREAEMTSVKFNDLAKDLKELGVELETIRYGAGNKGCEIEGYFYPEKYTIHHGRERCSVPITPKKPLPKKVIFSGPATTILWKDGTKTTVKCSDEDAWSDDVGVAMCYLKKMLGNKGNFNNIFREAAKVSDGCGWGFAKVKSSQVPESESYYSSALDSMKRNIDEINEFMKDAADALDKALGGKK